MRQPARYPVRFNSRRALRRGTTTGLLATIRVMAASDSVPSAEDPLPWSLLTKPPELTTLELAMGDLKQAMQPSTPMLESMRLLESASLGIRDVTDRVEQYLPEAEAALTAALRDRGHDPATAAAGAAADRMLAGLRHLAEASRTYAATLHDPDADGHAAESQLCAACAAAFTSLTDLIDGAS